VACFRDIVGVSGKAILHALAAGETDGHRLARLAHPSVRCTHEQLADALDSEIGEHHQFLIHELLTLIDGLDHSITHLEHKIEEQLQPFEKTLERASGDHRGQPADLARPASRGGDGYESLS
jgi:transposase